MLDSKDQKRLTRLLRDYYTEYYDRQLALPDHAERTQLRIHEENVYAAPNLDQVETLIGPIFQRGKQVLVVGGGTGAEFIQLARRGCEVYTVEPYSRAREILNLKAHAEGIDASRISKAGAEDLPYGNDAFDVIYSFMVMEHVADVRRSVQESVRVLKQDGWLVIKTPDYRQLYEGHYKMHLPLFLPRSVLKLILKAKGRPPAFLDDIQFVTSRQLRVLFRTQGLTALQVYKPHTAPAHTLRGWKRLMRWMQDTLEIEPVQFWLLKKTAKPLSDL